MTTKWLGDPLLHFLVIGAAIFVAVRLIVPPDASGQVIVVDDRLRTDLARKFEESTGRKAGETDLAAMVDAWVQEEALFREGMSLGFDQTDGFVRERIIALVRGSIKNAVALPTSAPPAGELQAYFQENRERYVEPPRFDLQHTIIRDTGSTARREAEHLLQQLQDGAKSAHIERRFLATNGRTAEQLSVIFGNDFTERLQTLDVGTWHLLASRRGWHVIRVDKVYDGKTPSFDEVSLQVLDDWREDRARELTGTQLRAIRSRYRVLGIDST